MCPALRGRGSRPDHGGGGLRLDLTFLFRRFPRLVYLVNSATNADFDEDMNLLNVLCDKRRTSVDVGAKVGMYLRRLVKVSKNVIAFEPVPELNRLLRANFARAEVPVEVRETALSSKAGPVTLRLPFTKLGFPKHGRATIERRNPLAYPDTGEIRSIQVRGETLDALAAADIGFIKIDVEGHELDVLKGGKRVLAKSRPVLVIEAQEKLVKNSVRNVAAFLRQFGYRGFFICGGRVRPVSAFSAADFPGVKNFLYLHRAAPFTAEGLEKALRKGVRAA